MADIVQMTQLSPTMTEGVLVEWLKKEGDLVKPGDALASVETDKAVMDLESFDEGILLALIAKPGERLPVGAAVAIVGNAGDDITALLEKATQKVATVQASAPAAASSAEEPLVTEKSSPLPEVSESQINTAEIQMPVPAADVSTKVKASPLARNLAGKFGIDLTQLKGSGPNGRIVRRDVEQAHREGGSASAANREKRLPDTGKPLSMMRQVIAKRLSDSKSHVPHFYLTRKIRLDRLVKLREEINRDLAELQSAGHPFAGYPNKISINDFIIKANALALAKNPEVNAQWGQDKLIIKGNIDIGVAVAMEDGLITPIIRNADRKSLFTIAIEIKSLAEKARKRKLAADEYTNGSFTISNLGMFGIDSFQAIINAPEAALMAVGKSVLEPVFDPTTGGFAPVEMLTVTLSCDHRVVDGAKGAEFLRDFAFFMENPHLI